MIHKAGFDIITEESYSDMKAIEKVNNRISPSTLRIIEQNCRKSFSSILPRRYNFDKMASDFVSIDRAREELQRLSHALPDGLAGKKLLEIGSGYGMLVALARKEFSVEAYGIEPSEQFEGTFTTSIQVLSEMGIQERLIQQGTAEELPYDNEQFDVVYSSNVLEHVNNPQKVFKESIRVTKKGGYITAVIPNYGSWWEGHYGIIMPPYSPAWLLKCIVKIIGRDSSFIDTLQLITWKKLQGWLKPYYNTVEVIDWGQKLWIDRLRYLNFSEWAHLGFLKSVLQPLHALKLTEPIILLGRLFHWETPFFLIMRKK